MRFRCGQVGEALHVVDEYLIVEIPDTTHAWLVYGLVAHICSDAVSYML